MSYSVAHEYSPVETSDVSLTVESAQDPTIAIVSQIKKSGRVVTTICLLQLLAATLAFINAPGTFSLFAVTAVFTSFGLVGVSRARHSLIAAHFVYSVVIYVLTLVGIVLLIMRLNCDLLTYWIFFLVVLIEAIGLKHSRVLIQGLRLLEAGIRETSRPSAVPSAPAAVEVVPQQQQQAFYMPTQPGMPQMYPMMYPTANGQFQQGVPMMQYPYMQFAPYTQQ